MKTILGISQHPCEEWRALSKLSFQDQYPKPCSIAGLVRSPGPLPLPPNNAPPRMETQAHNYSHLKAGGLRCHHGGVQMALSSQDAHSQTEVSYSTPLTGST